MNKKAFTLAELMGVIIILTVVALVVIPLIDKNIKKSREVAFTRQVGNIENGAKDWSLKNLDSLPEVVGENITITLSQLKQEGFLPLNIKNPLNDLLFPNDMLITITKTSTNYTYNVRTDTGIYINENNYNPLGPIIILNGNYLEYAEISLTNADYIDKGFVAKTYEGNVIPTSEVTVHYFLNGEQCTQINTNAFNTYNINYTVTNNGITTKVNRTVIVRDSIAPILTIPEISTISKSEVASFNLLAGVSVSDNSGETLTISTSGTVENKVGKYTITYSATDSSGNNVIRKRIINVTD